MFFFFILSHAVVFNFTEDEDFSILLDALEGNNSSLNFPVSSGRTCERGYELVTLYWDLSLISVNNLLVC